MVRNLLFIGFAIFAFCHISYSALSQDYYSRLVLTAEFSPSFPMETQRIFENPSKTNSLGFRTRMGMRTFGNLFVGINATLRNHRESAIFSFTSPNASRIEQEVTNTLWGLGPFATQFIPVSERFYIIVSGYGNLEQGKGYFASRIVEGSTDVGKIVSQRNIRDINLTAGIDLGFGILINPYMGVKLTIQPGGYQRQSIRTGPQIIQDTGPFGLRVDVDESSSGIFTFAQRPVFNIGVFMSIGEWKY